MYEVPDSEPSALFIVEGEAVYPDNSSHLVRDIWPLTDDIGVMRSQSVDGRHIVGTCERNTLPGTATPLTSGRVTQIYEPGATFRLDPAPPGWETWVRPPELPSLPNITVYGMNRVAQQPTPEA